MNLLELKVPPPIVALLVAGGMWVVRDGPTIAMPAFLRITLALALALAGGYFSIAGMVSFRRARTTVNPMKPDTASTLVTGGIYRITRNPMYVGLCIVLVAWAVYLSSPWALAGPAVFLLYITRFQILPEEKALRALFGSEFAAYQERVRRWL